DVCSSDLDAVASVLSGHRREHLTAHLCNQRPEGLLHVPYLPEFVVAPFPVETKNRNTPLVLYLGIELTEGICVWDHLPAAGEPYSGAVVPSVVVLQRFAIAAA